MVSSCVLLTKPLILFSFQNMLWGDVKGVSIYKPLLSVHGLIQADDLKGQRSWCQYSVISGQLLKGKGASNFQLCLQELSVFRVSLCRVSLWPVWWETWPFVVPWPFSIFWIRLFSLLCQRLQVSFVHALGFRYEEVLAAAGWWSSADSYAHRVSEHDGGGKRAVHASAFGRSASLPYWR